MGFFSSITDALFGSKPSASINPVTTLSPEQKKLMNEILTPYLSQPIDQAGGSYDQPMVAGLTSQDQLLQDQLGPILDQIMGGTSAATDALTALLNPTAADTTKYFNDVIKAPLLDTFTKDIQPMIGKRYAGQFFGSDRKNADSRAFQDLNQSLTTAQTDFGYRARESDLNRVLQAAGLLPSVTSGASSALAGLEGIASTQRNVDQAGLSASYQEFLRQQDEKNKRIEQILQALGLSTRENVATVTPGTQGLVGSFLGSAGGSKAIAGLF